MLKKQKIRHTPKYDNEEQFSIKQAKKIKKIKKERIKYKNYILDVI